jgi:hypothetical protein
MESKPSDLGLDIMESKPSDLGLLWTPKNSLSLFALFLNVWKYLVKIPKQSFVLN